MLLPVDYVFLGAVRRYFRLRHYCRDQVPNWDDNVIAEARLFFRHNRSFPIAKETGAHLIGLFDVTLDEELVEEQVGPFSQSVELARRCG